MRCVSCWRGALSGAGRLTPVANRIDFLGYTVRPDYLLVRQRLLGHLHFKLRQWHRCIQRADGSLRRTPQHADRLQALLASSSGHLAHARSRPARAEV